MTSLNVTLFYRDLVDPFDLWDSDALPSFAPNPPDFSEISQTLGQIQGQFNGQNVFVNIDLETVSVVPVPAAIWLFGAALVGLLGFSKRKTPT